MFNPESVMVVARTLAGDGRADRRTSRAPRKRRAEVTAPPAGQAARRSSGSYSSRPVRVAIAPPRPHAGERREGIGQAIDVPRRGPEPHAGAHGARQRGRRPARSSARSRASSAPGTSEQPRHQRMRAEAAVPDADRVLGAQDRGDQRIAVAGEREGRHADALGAAGQRRSVCRPRISRSPSHRRSASARSCSATASMPSSRSRRQAAAERDDADDVRRPGLVALGRVRPDHVVERDELDRAAAGEQRRARVQPPPGGRPARPRRTARRACGRRTRGSRCRSRPCRSARCGASCAASTKSSRAVAVRERGELARRGQISPVTFDAPVTASRSNRSRRAARRSHASSSSSAERGNGQQPTSWRRQGSMLAWCSTGLLSTRVPAGSAAARTLIASVVLRTNTTSSSGARADEPRDVLARVLERGGGRPATSRRCRGGRCCTRA